MIFTAHARSSAIKLICIVIQLTCQSTAFYVAEILMKRKHQRESSKIHLACSAEINSLKTTCRQLSSLSASYLWRKSFPLMTKGQFFFFFLSFFLSLSLSFSLSFFLFFFCFLSLLVFVNNVVNENTQTYLKYSSRPEQQRTFSESQRKKRN